MVCSAGPRETATAAMATAVEHRRTGGQEPAVLPRDARVPLLPHAPPVAGSVPRLGLLVLSHGAAESMDEVEPYYAHILHGRTPRPERLQALRERYRAIGGRSPLNPLARRQAGLTAAGLREMGVRAHPYVGFQHVPPFIANAVQAIAADGVREVVAIVMTPYYSPAGTGPYLRELGEAARDSGVVLQIRAIRSWYHEQEFLGLLVGRVRDALEKLAPQGAEPHHVIFTAHSLPIPVQPVNDPYVEQFTATARAVAVDLGLLRWSTCYQSASVTGRPWLGPDILEELSGVCESGARGVVVCPSSFAADNLEVLYDIGIEAAAHARRLGMAFVQTAPLNDDPVFTGFLARMLARRLSNDDGRRTTEDGAAVTPIAHTPTRPHFRPPP